MEEKSIQHHEGSGDIIGRDKISINLNSPDLSFEINPQRNNKVEAINIKYSWERDLVSSFSDKFLHSNYNQFNLFGLPLTGKTTVVKQILSKISKINGTKSYYIPSKNLSDKELFEIIHKFQEPKGNIIIAIDDFHHDKNLFNSKKIESRLLLVHNNSISKYEKVYADNSVYLKPLEDKEFLSYFNGISSFYKQDISLPILQTMHKQSGGIIDILNVYLNYFNTKGRLPNFNEIITYLADETKNTIANFFNSLDDDKLNFLLSLFITRKKVSELSRGDLNDVNSHYVKIGINEFVKSDIFKNLLLDKSRKNPFFILKAYAENLKQSNQKKQTLIWTADFDLKEIAKDFKLIDLCASVFKNHAIRLDLSKTKVNGLPTSLNYVFKDGDYIQFVLRREMLPHNLNEALKLVKPNLKKYLLVKKRGEYYSKNRKDVRLKIGKADNLCDEELYWEAEKIYQEVIYSKNSTDANWAKVRLANLYRIQGKLEKSEQLCETILRTTPNPFAYNCFGICNLWRGNIFKATQFFEKATELKQNPLYINAQLYKCRTLLHLRKFEEADENYHVIKKFRSKSKSLKSLPSFQEYFIGWCIYMLNPKYRNKSEFFTFNLRQKIFDEDIKEREYPLAMLFMSVNNLTKYPEFSKINKKSEEALQKRKGLKYDLFIWFKFLSLEFDFEEKIEFKFNELI